MRPMVTWMVGTSAARRFEDSPKAGCETGLSRGGAGETGRGWSAGVSGSFPAMAAGWRSGWLSGLTTGLTTGARLSLGAPASPPAL